jgi:hypothetical protein
MNAQQLAALLNGREYRNEITDEEAEQAKAAGLVAVFGASDDLMEIRGAIYDEVDCYDGESILIDAKGVLPSWDSASESEESAKDYFERKAKARAIEALWCEEDGYDWAYETDIPHEKFEIVEDGAPYCRGIVFSLSDIGEQK